MRTIFLKHLVVAFLFTLSFVAPVHAQVTGFGAAVSVDESTYATDLMPPSVRPPVITMTLTIFNYSRNPVTFDFTTSQRFDFAIIDSVGREVWRWSKGQVFLPVVGSLTLMPGQSVSYPVRHTFGAAGGTPYPQGLYTVLGELTAFDRVTRTRRTMDGRVSFRHQFVY